MSLLLIGVLTGNKLYYSHQLINNDITQWICQIRLFTCYCADVSWTSKMLFYSG